VYRTMRRIRKRANEPKIEEPRLMDNVIFYINKQNLQKPISKSREKHVAALQSASMCFGTCTKRPKVNIAVLRARSYIKRIIHTSART